MATRGIYVHVPYCLAKCGYCDFNSYPSASGVPDRYVQALLADIRSEAPRWGGDGGFATVYLGGGTPSLLSAAQAARILEALQRAFDVASNAEITLECNPATVDEAALAAFREAGVNRLSVGVQSLEERELAFLGRLHGPGDALETLASARRAGFADISADVMFGIPGQTAETISATLEGVLGGLTHLSAYMLSVESGTELARMVASGAVRLPEEAAVAGQYQLVAGLLASRGFVHYEISNWCRDGRSCRHNQVYWRRGEYLGLGAGAHSHRAGTRTARIRDPVRYEELARAGLAPVDFRETLTPGQVALEEVMLGLRTSRGLAPDALAESYGLRRDALEGRLAELAAAGLVVRGGKRWSLSARGLLVHEAVCEFLADLITPATF